MPLSSYYSPSAVLGFACQLPREQMRGELAMQAVLWGSGRMQYGGRRRQHSGEPQVGAAVPSALGGGRPGGAGLTPHVRAQSRAGRAGQQEPRAQAGCGRHRALDTSDLVLAPVLRPGPEPGSALPQRGAAAGPALRAVAGEGEASSPGDSRPGASVRPEAPLQTERPWETCAPQRMRKPWRDAGPACCGPRPGRGAPG